MSRLAPPLILLAALAAGRAHAQAGDRYGPRAAPEAAIGYAPQPHVRTAYANTPAPAAAPPLRGPAPALRSLSWPGKAELRPAVYPGAPAAGYSFAAPAPAPAPSGRFPGMAAYAAPPPALRRSTGVVEAPSASSVRSPYAAAPRAVARAPRPAISSPPAPYAARPGLYATAPAAGAPRPAAYAPGAYAIPPYGNAPGPADGPAVGSTLPVGLASAPAYVPPGPASAPMLAAQARQQAQVAAASAADTLPPPTVGHYGYVGPGRTASGPPAPASYAAVMTPPTGTPAPGSAPGMGPPRPPAYARAYVMPPAAGAAQPAAPSTDAAVRPGDGGRRYSVHREYGMEPDPAPVPPQFFTATADLSEPETAPAPMRGKAAVNAARLAAANP